MKLVDKIETFLEAASPKNNPFTIDYSKFEGKKLSDHVNSLSAYLNSAAIPGEFGCFLPPACEGGS